jgi:hypothetical protein
MDHGAMARRIVIAVLWAYATWIAYSVAALVLPGPIWMGPLLAAVVGLVVAWRPGRLSVRHSTQRTATSFR